MYIYMLKIEAVQSFSFKMSVKNLGFPLPVKIEEDQKLFIDLDTEGNSPEDIVIEWHLEIRRFFGSYSASSGETKLISIMKEYITTITERAIHFEDIIRLQDMVDNHMEHIYWFYRDSDICCSNMYLDYMEHILTFYVNLTLRVLLVLKKKIKVTQKKVNDLTQMVIKRLSLYLLRSEHHIFHVLIRQTTTLVDGMIKDVMNILHSNICKQMFRNLYMHFLVLTPVKDMSDEAFCRAYILFENWKAFEDYKQNEKIEECVKNIYNRDVHSIRENEFLRKILIPQSSIMSELMSIMGCDPSITKAYFDFIKTKQREVSESIDDIGKLALEDTILSETELMDEDDCETAYMEIFENIMEDTTYNLNDVVLTMGSCKNEEVLSEEATDEILILDTDSDSDVEIVSIVPSVNNTRPPNSTRRNKNPAQPTSFLDSISLEVDTSRRKYGFRNLGNTDNPPQQKTTATTTTHVTDKTSEPNTVEDHDSDLEVILDEPMEPCLIIDDDTPPTDNNNKIKDTSTTEEHTSKSVSNSMQNSSEKDISTSDNVASTSLDTNSLKTDVPSVPPETLMELEIVESSSLSDNPSVEKNAVTDSSKIAVTESSEIVVTESSKIAVTESSNIAVTESSKIAVTESSKIVVTDSSEIAVTESSKIAVPDSSENTVTDSSKMAVGDSPKVALTVSTEIAVTNLMEVTVLSTSRRNEEESTSLPVEVLPVSKDPPALKNSQGSFSLQTNGIVNHICRCSQLFKTPVLAEEENVKSSDVIPTISSTMENVEMVDSEENACLEERSENENVNTEEALEVVDVRANSEQNNADSCNLDEIGNNLEVCDNERVELSLQDESSSNQQDGNVENLGESLIGEKSEAQQVEKCENFSIENQFSALSIASESITKHLRKPKNGCSTPSVVQESKVNTNFMKDLDECQARDRTSKCDKTPEVFKCRTEPQLEEPTMCESGCGKDETNSHSANNEKTDNRTNLQSEETTPLDTGQDQFVQPLDTGQFDANSPASPDNEVNLKSPCEKVEVKILRTVSEPLLRKGQHGEFGYPTPPGSEEERDKDSDEQTKLIYSTILPTQKFGEDEIIDPHDSENEQVPQLPYQAQKPENVQKQDLLLEEIDVIGSDKTNTDKEALLRLSNNQKGDTSPSLSKTYEQIVKDAIGSQNSTEDEEDKPHSVQRKYNKDKDQDMSFDEMEQFLKNCDNEDYPQGNRKKRKRPREKNNLEESRSRKDSPKRVKINEKTETYFITTPYDEDSKDDVWENENVNEYDSSSSSEVNETSSDRLRAKVKRRPSPMPVSKYLSKRNGALTHVPLSGRLSPDKPPPLKGILKRIEQKHIYHPLHPVDDEPESVVIVLHQREVGRGKRGSIEVKVYRKSFSAYRIPFDDHKLCHHAFVKMKAVGSEGVGRVSGRTRHRKEEMFELSDKPMYKIVFDKKTPQLNSNDRKYFCDPLISSSSSASSKPNKSTLSENEQGTVNLSTEIAFVKTPEPLEPEPAIQPPISPPCFSPSSNSSSEFSDPTNLIPYQDIERALQVVEPDKPEEHTSGYGLECHDSNDSLEKSLVDRIALETIELLSDNADFHKMLRDLNGEILIENIPLIGIEETENIGNVTVAPETNDDLVSNLNSDEQLLKKVCQELESEALVDNLGTEPPSSLIVTESFLDENVHENRSEVTDLVFEMAEQEIQIEDAIVESDQICYQEEHELHLSSSFLKISNDGFSLHPTIPSIDSSSVPATEVNYSAVNTHSVTVNYSSPMISPVLNSFHPETFSSVPESTLVHSDQSHMSFAALNSPTFTSKHSPPILTFHQDPYSSFKQFSSNQITDSEATLSSNSTPISRESPVQILHQQTLAAIPNLPPIQSGYNEAAFSSSSPLVRITAPLVPPIPNTLHQESYYSSIPDSSLVHSGISMRVASPSTVFSTSNSLHQTVPSNNVLKSFLPDPPLTVPVYTEDSLRSTSCSLLSHQSNATTPSLFTTNGEMNSFIHNFPTTLPTYTETNCLIPNVPLSQAFSENKCIVPSLSSVVLPCPERRDPIFTSTPLNTYTEPSTSFPRISESAYAPNSEIHCLRSSRFPPNLNSTTHSVPKTNITQTGTDSSRKRLPKEVLTISQLNKSKSPNIDCLDNNSKQNAKTYFKKSKDCMQARDAQKAVNPDRRLRNTYPTNELCKNTGSRDPRLGQPLICVPPPFIQSSSRPNFMINLLISPEIRKKLALKKSLAKKSKHHQTIQKLPIRRMVATKSITKAKISNSISSCQASRKFADLATTQDSSQNVVDSTISQSITKKVVDSKASRKETKNMVDPVVSLSTSKNIVGAPTVLGVSSNIPTSVASLNIHKNSPEVIPILGTSKSDHNPVSILEAPSTVAYSVVSSKADNNNVVIPPTLMTHEKIENDIGKTIGSSKNDSKMSLFLEAPKKVSGVSTSKNDLEPANFLQVPKIVQETVASSAKVKEVLVTPTSKALPTHQKVSIVNQTVPNDQGTKRTKPKTTGRKRGRPPKNSRPSFTNDGNKNVQDNIPPNSRNIPPIGVHVISNNCSERVPPMYHTEVSQRRYPVTRNASQPRVEPLKIIKDPKSKKGYNKVVKVNTSVPTVPLPMPVPETYNFEGDTLKTELYNLKLPENNENEVEFETHLPLKKRKLSMPVPSSTQAQPTTLANVPRSRDKKEEISYPATPMLSIADVYMQPRTFKTPAEKKQLPPESSNTVPIHYEAPPAPEPQFNCSLNTYNPAMYGFGKCPYSVDLDCNSFCPTPVLFPPEPFTHTN